MATIRSLKPVMRYVCSQLKTWDKRKWNRVRTYEYIKLIANNVSIIFKFKKIDVKNKTKICRNGIFT